VILLYVGGSKASDIRNILKLKIRIGKTKYCVGLILHDEEDVDAAVCELNEKTCLILSPDDLTLLDNNPFRVSLPEARHQLVYVFTASVPVPFVSASTRTPSIPIQVVSTHSRINPDGTYVVPFTIGIDDLSLAPTKI
jgi:hypothetical protein